MAAAAPRNEAADCFLPYACRRLVILTNWGYPYGGGEAFLKDSVEWCRNMFTEIIWLSFMHWDAAAGHVPNQTFHVTASEAADECFAAVSAPGPMTREALDFWLGLLDPDVVHHQGSLRELVVTACADFNVPVLTGYHFWHGAIVLAPETQNFDMQRHIGDHTFDPELGRLIARATAPSSAAIGVYWASAFVKNIVSQVAAAAAEDNNASSSVRQYIAESTYIIAPVSSEKTCCAWPADAASVLLERKYITQINVHPGKGGCIIQHCAQAMPDERFQCIVTDASLAAAADENLYIVPRTDNMAVVYARTKVLLIPSVVDETFCRVAFEGLMNGLPIIASPSGYMKTMLAGCAGAILMPSCTSAPAEWKDVLQALVMSSPKVFECMAMASRKRYLELLTQYNSKNLLREVLLNLCCVQTRRKNVMIFAPWADQGLGVQARNYVRMLETYSSGRIVTHIFSFKPYYAGRHQKDPVEWEHPRCYYSENIREAVTDSEIVQFVAEWQIGTAIIPETCWNRVFEIADLMKHKLRLRVYAVPNVEILRSSELDRHEQVFDALLCSNAICHHVLWSHSEYLGTMAIRVGYAVDGSGSSRRQRQQQQHKKAVRFLCLGGMNAFSRKQVDVVCRAFEGVVADAHLTVTNQNECEAARMAAELGHSSSSRDENITCITKALAYNEIVELYAQTDVVIQVSKHEGIGIGFYEALAHGKPVITLDVPPHNEIIIPGVNGWRIPAQLRPNTENNESLLGSAYFDPAKLTECINAEVMPVMRDPALRDALHKTIDLDYGTRFSMRAFANRFINAIRLNNSNHLY